MCPARLLDHLIGQEEQGGGHRDPERLGGLEVDDQLELRGLLHRQVGGLGTLQDLVHIRRPAPPRVRRARPIADERRRPPQTPVSCAWSAGGSWPRARRAVCGAEGTWGPPRRGAPPRAHWSWPRRRCQTRRDCAPPRGAAGRPTAGPPRPPPAPWRAWAGLAGFQRMATRETVGSTSLRNSSCFPTSSGARAASPVTLPPGRARLATRPLPTGSLTPTITMGIVVVACLAASAAGVSPHHQDVHLETDQLGREGREPLVLPCRHAVLHDEVLAFDIAERAHPLQESPHKWVSSWGSTKTRQRTDPVHVRWRLRLGCERRHAEASESKVKVMMYPMMVRLTVVSSPRSLGGLEPRARMGHACFFPWKPNATRQALAIAGAKNERRLLPVACTRLLDMDWESSLGPSSR